MSLTVQHPGQMSIDIDVTCAQETYSVNLSEPQTRGLLTILSQ